MASHRKPRTRILESPAGRRTAVGMSSAALASVTLLSQEAGAAPAKPSIEEVQKKVDNLYRQAEQSTDRYNGIKERTSEQRVQVDKKLDEVAERTEKLNEARRDLGRIAAAQYRTGGLSPTATFLLSSDPQDFFDQNHLMDRLSGHEQQMVDNFRTQQASATKERTKATKSLGELTESQQELKDTKEEVQTKLTEAQKLLNKLSAEEKARLAELERKREAEAKRKAQEAEQQRQEELAEQQRQEAAAREQAQEEQEQAEEPAPAPAPAPSKAEQVLAFGEAQLGKPYVWGATGPDSYDCSGFTQAAWKSAGVSLPRTTYDQVNAGAQVAKADMRPGDLIFFYDDISHVGIYVGGGQMIHASKPGDDVKYESVDYMPFHSAVRPG